MSRGFSVIRRTTGMGLVGIAEVASMADAINSPYQIEDYGDYFGQSPTHFCLSRAVCECLHDILA